MTLSLTWTRRVLLTLAVFVTIVAATYVEEDWRGHRDWHRVQAVYEARHDPLGIEAFLGAPVPDKVNLFKAPVWAELTSEHTPPSELRRARAAAGWEKIVEVAPIWNATLSLDDLRRVMIAKGLIAKDDSRPVAEAVLAGLQPVAAFCDALRTAAHDRPVGASASEPPLRFNDLRIGEVYTVAKVFAFRARVELAAGKPREAFDDTLTLLRIAHACEFAPPTVMQSLVAIAMAGQADDVVHRACTGHAWSAAQLSELQGAYDDLRLTSYFASAFRSERAWQLAVLDQLPSLNLSLLPFGLRSERRRFALARWVPRGWLDENKVVLCREFARELAPIDAFGTPEYTRALAQLDVPGDGDDSAPILFLSGARGRMPAFANVIKDAGRDLEAINAATIALALERYHLAHGRYPDALDALAPDYLAAVPRRSDGSAYPYEPTHDGHSFELEELPAPQDQPRA